MTVWSRFLVISVLLLQIACMGCQGNVKSQVVKLNDPRPDVRRAAADELGRVAKKEAVVPLIKSLDDEDPEVVLSSLTALDRLGDDRSIAPLIRLLGHDDAAVRFLSKMALIRSGSKTVPSLLVFTPDQTAETQVSIIDILSKIGKKNPHVVSNLGRIVNGPFLDRVRMAAAGALGQLGDTQGVGPLIQTLTDQSSPIRYVARDALVRIGAPAVDPLIELLDRDNAETVRLSINALGKIGHNRAVIPLIDKLNSKQPEIKRAANDALVAIGASAVLPLIELSRSAELTARKTASNILVRIGIASVPLLILELKIEPPGNLTLIGDMLIRIGGPAAEALILDMAHIPSDNQSLVSTIITTIGEPAVSPLIEALRRKNTEMTGQYVRILGRIGHARAVDPLVDAMAGGTSAVRLLAQEALIRIGVFSATPLIRAIVEGEKETEGIRDLEFFNPIVAEKMAFKRRASKVLIMIGEPAVPLLIDFLKKEGRVENRIADALLQLMGTRAATKLINVLGDTDPAVQSRASKILIDIGSPAVKDLISVFKTEEHYRTWMSHPFLLGGESLFPKRRFSKYDLDTIWQVTWILGEIGDRRAVKTLTAALSHEAPVVRMLAVEALGKIGDDAAIDPLVATLSDWPVRHRTANALEKLKWKPSSVTDRIRYLIGKDEMTEVVRQSVTARETLVADLQSGESRRMAYAVFAFVNLWGSHGITALIEQLDRSGNLALAETFAISGYDLLIVAAENWAKRYGYDLPQTGCGLFRIAP